jgi:urease accessory protein
MLRLTHRVAPPESQPSEHVSLPFEKRTRSRLRVRLVSGREAILMLDRGLVLRDGDVLVSDTGEHVRVESAPEVVSVARGETARDVARAAYHLGNRHTAVEVGDGFVAYLHDHVLDDMVRRLGLLVRDEKRKFEPEGGAYDNHGHGHGQNAHTTNEQVHHHEHDHLNEALFEEDLGERLRVERGNA